MKQPHPRLYPPSSAAPAAARETRSAPSPSPTQTFPSHKTSPVNAAFLRANSVCIPFQSHRWETDKTIRQITLAEGCSRTTRAGGGGPPGQPPGFMSRRRRPRHLAAEDASKHPSVVRADPSKAKRSSPVQKQTYLGPKNQHKE